MSITTTRWRFDTGVIAQAVLLLALVALAWLLLQWQSEAPQWQLPGTPRLFAATAVLFAYGVFAGIVIVVRRERLRRFLPRTQPGIENGWVVAYASQTGHAEALARRTWQTLDEAGIGADLVPLGTLDLDSLARYRRALFVVSTTGEGDAPDSALRFVRNILPMSAEFPDLRYGVLALGDREYARFCAFGHRIDGWLRHSGAETMFDLVEVDNGDAGALRHWQHHLGLLAGRTDLSDWNAPAYRRWRLAQRSLANAGSVGAPVFHVALDTTDAGDLAWEPGDIAEVGPRNSDQDVSDWLQASRQDGTSPVSMGGRAVALAELLRSSHLPAPTSALGLPAQTVADSLRPLPHREYSIASLPSDGSLQLLVRQMWRGDGRLGSGSGWLTAHAPIGSEIDVRIRSNPGFRPPVDERPLVMVGNGTGIAGLRALIKSRVESGRHRNWLLFGERNAAHDFHYGDEVLAWQREGLIERVDLAFSRDDGQRTYVQHLLQQQLPLLREWLEAGASVHVCGSLEGMAPAVDAVLREAVGVDALEAMTLEGRYCRDVY